MPTDWEQRYKTGDTPWDKSAPHPALVDFLEMQPLRRKILVPGSGLGHDVRAISRGDNEVTGIDIAPSAVERARTFQKSAGENYRLADLFDLPPELCGVFDWVWEHTCFCAIDPARRADYARSVADALKPGGHLLAVFYLDPGNGDDGPPFGVSTIELNALFLPRFELLRDWEPLRTYAGREHRERMRLLRRKE
jgi:SAM-dependent methyltransferase